MPRTPKACGGQTTMSLLTRCGEAKLRTTSPPSGLIGPMSESVTVLEREVYSEAEAARLLGVSQGTLHYWLEGGERRGTLYQPVIRREATGKRTVTWGEFVESGLLRAYRKHSIPMTQLRDFISTLRDELDIPYPLAHKAPWLSRGAGLVMKAQEAVGLDPSFWLWSSGQGMLTFTGASFVERIRWEGHIAGSYRPHDDPKSPVTVNPRIRFGRPSIGGISTRAIFEQSEGGASVGELSKLYGLSVRDVRWALAYEGTKAA